MHADKILMLDKGLVVQEGTHAQLSIQKGIYRQLCEIQGAIEKQIEEDIHKLDETTVTLGD